MVNRKKILIFAAAAVLGVSLPAPGGPAFAEQTEESGESVQTQDIREAVLADVGDGTGQQGGDQDNAASGVMHGPDVPPSGMRYDEWKGFRYTKDTKFNLRTYWTVTMYDHSVPEDHGLFRDPEHIEDAVLEIVDAKAEPVGGEMKLRSGGFVDITIELYWSGTMNGTEAEEMYEHYYRHPWYVQWNENTVYPCDAYTGISLLNYTGVDDTEDGSISPGQASASSMAESDVTWQGRTYRLFAKSDIRNASFDDWYEHQDGDKYRFTIPCALETTITLRVPADYDGMVLAIDKDITDQRDAHITKNGEFISFSDLYADILTTSSGVRQSADDFYFIKVSDLLEHFQSQH